MKKTLLLLIVCFATTYSFAQTLSATVLPTQGDYFTTSGGNVSWTLGEIATETLTTSGNILTQGFQQPDLRIDIYVKEINGNILSVYPNPTFDDVIVDLSKMNGGNYLVSVFDITGKLMSEGNYASGNSESVCRLSLGNYAAGTYMLVLTNNSINYKNSIKIFKSN